MSDKECDLQRALTAIDNSDMRYPQNRILERFLELSIDPDASARYLRCDADTGSLDLEPLLADWNELVSSYGSQERSPSKELVRKVHARDGDRCCISGLQASLFDPLIVAPIPSMHSPITKSQSEILEVFLGHDLTQELQEHATHPDGPQNYWLVRQTAAIALSQGYIKVEWTKGPEAVVVKPFLTSTHYTVSLILIGGPDRPSILDKMPTIQWYTFEDNSKSGIPLPDSALIKALARFAEPIRWSLVAKDIASRHPQPLPITKTVTSFLHQHLSGYAAVVISTVCHLLPSPLRTQFYLYMCRLGVRLYGPSSSFNAQRLPFGMYLKLGSQANHQGLANEYGTLQHLRNHTTVPVPRPLDLVSSSEATYLITSRVPGQPAGACIGSFTESEMDTFKRDLQQYLNQIRAIPKQVAPDHAICNAIGGPCHDFRISASQPWDEERGDFFGPFVDEDEFNKTLQTPALPGITHSSGHKIVFTHGDINMRNVMVHNGRISGIIDWENAGWFLDYWEHTKIHYVTKLHNRWLKAMDEVFCEFGDFKTEHDTEFQLWCYCF